VRKPTSYEGPSKDFAVCYANSVLKPMLLLGGDRQPTRSEVTRGARAALRMHNLTASPHDLAGSPHNLAGSPRNLAGSPDDPAHDLGFVRLLVNEIQARHHLLEAEAAALNATERGAVQLTFSCIHAWLRAAGANIMPPSGATARPALRPAPFDRLQGGWGEEGRATSHAGPAGVCHAGGRVGYCDVTTEGPSDCRTDDKGSWTLRQQEGALYEDLFAQCKARCMQCANCNYVSVSKGGRYGATKATCDWFRNCTSGPLQTAFGGGTYTTFEVIRGRG